jgi:hypothetical protein
VALGVLCGVKEEADHGRRQLRASHETLARKRGLARVTKLVERAHDRRVEGRE